MSIAEHRERTVCIVGVRLIISLASEYLPFPLCCGAVFGFAFRVSAMFVECNQLKHAATMFRERGVVGIRQFLDRDATTKLRRQFERYVSNVVPQLPPEDAFYDQGCGGSTLKQLVRMEQYDPWFDELRRDSEYVSLAENLLGGSVVSHGVEWFNKPARTGRPTPPHQDGYYFCMDPPNTVTFWIALQDADESNGCLQYVVGSHRDGLRPHGVSDVLGFSQTVSDFGDDDRRRLELAPAKSGDLIAHHGLTIHLAAANESERDRPSLGMVFFRADAKRDEAAFARYTASSRDQQTAVRAS